MSDAKESWLPNLVGGVSIWKLASDLNDPKFFGGRLLEPETEGSDSLPAKVSWDLTGLMPLSEARQQHPQQTEAAIAEFFACLERVAAVLGDETSGYHKFKDAFTVPALDADDGAYYFYGPDSNKLYVINWGASPRTISQEQQYLFGYANFDQLFKKEGIVPGRGERPAVAPGDDQRGAEPAEPAAARAPAEAAADQAPGSKQEAEDEEAGEKPEAEGRPWWIWLLVAMGIIVVIVVIILLLRSCAEDGPLGDRDAGAGGEAADGAALDGAAAAGDAASAAGGAGGAAADADAGADAAGEGAGGEAGAGTAGAGTGTSGAGGGPAAGSGTGADAGGKGTVVVVEPGTGDGTLVVKVAPDSQPSGYVPVASGQPHRAHYHPRARSWRIVGGAGEVDRVEGRGATYHVFLKPGSSFQRVQVQWQDEQGNWHNH